MKRAVPFGAAFLSGFADGLAFFSEMAYTESREKVVGACLIFG